MTQKTSLSPLWLSVAASVLILSAQPVCAQNAATSNEPAKNAPSAPAAKASPVLVAPVQPTAPTPDRSQAYFHAAMAGIYEEAASTQGRPDYVTRAIEEYKAALNSDPTSTFTSAPAAPTKRSRPPANCSSPTPTTPRRTSCWGTSTCASSARRRLPPRPMCWIWPSPSTKS